MDQPASTPMTPLAIVGLGCLFPGATNAHAFWANIREGVDSIEPIPATHWNPEDYFNSDPKKRDHTYAARGGFIPQIDFKPLDFGITPTAIEATDTSQLLGLVAARQALEDAGYGSQREFDRSRTSVILGVTGALELVIPLGARLGHPLWRKALLENGIDANIADKVVDRISQGYVEWQENSFPGLLGNVVAGRIANRLDLGGTNCVVDAACASSLSALHLAALELQTGLSDMVVTGGVDTFNDIFMYMCFSKTPALSPTGNAKPFAADGDGTILGEGLGILVVKRIADAERDGDRVYAILKGIGSSSDGKGNAIYAPSAEGQKKALRNAYCLSGVEPGSIDLVEGHGTGTKVGDATELSALTEMYRVAGVTGSGCAVGSVKSQIGHTKAAAGAAGVIKAALALYHKTLPPSIKVEKPLDPLVGRGGPFYLNATKRPWLSRPGQPRRAAVSAFGFGGSNFHCVLEEAAPRKNAVDWSADIEIVAFSGNDPQTLDSRLQEVAEFKEWDLVRVAAKASRASFDPKAEHRLLAVIEQRQSNTGSFAATVYRGTGRPKKIAAIFSGQGSQQIGMARDLACQFPEMLDALELANSVFARHPTNLRLSDAIYPPPAFDAGISKQDDAVLRATDVAQPALAAIELGMLAILRRFGVAFDFVAGHSFGELTALHAAEVFDADALLSLACHRGRLMAESAGDQSGAMLAVHASAADVESALKQFPLDVVIANKNSPTQTVVSGRIDAIAKAETVFAKANLRTTRLPVAAGFHSSMVAPAAESFGRELQQIAFAFSKMPVFANTTARPYPTEVVAMRELLANQLAKPVDFVGIIDAMSAADVDTFVEIGPGSKLARLIGNADGRTALAVDSSEGRRHGMLDLATLLAQLAVAGHAVQLSAWNADLKLPQPAEKSKASFTVRLSGANHVPEDRRAVWKSTPSAGSTLPLGPQPTVVPAPPHIPPKSIAAVVNTKERPATPIMPNPQSAPLTRVSPPQAMQLVSNGAGTALDLIQRNLDALRRMQEQTSQVHLRYLEGQEAALSAYHSLTESQSRLLFSVPAMANVPASLPASSNGHSVALPAPKPKFVDPTPVALRNSPSEKAYETGNGKSVVAASASPAPSSPPPAKAVAKSSNANLIAGLLGIVAEKTGYPVEMLELDMQLDADLGIDSIKRVEILSAVQEKFPEAPPVQSDQIGAIRTLREVVDLISTTSPDTTGDRPPNQLRGADQQTANVTDRSGDLSHGLAEGVLAIVAEKTGYPVEMLELDMQLDADLGIDSIKRVEILSAVQEKFPHTPTIQSDQIGAIRTLREVMNHLGGAPVDDAAPTETAPNLASPSIETRPSAVVRYAIEAVSVPPIAERAPIGLRADSELVLVDDGDDLAKSIAAELRNRGFGVLTGSLDALLQSEPSRRLAGLIVPSPVDGCTPAFLADALQLARKFGPNLMQAANADAALFATISRQDGNFGIDAGNDSLSGALAGLTKTAAREWPAVTCRAMDTESDSTGTSIVDELLAAGPVEIGLRDSAASGLRLVEQPVVVDDSVPVLNAGDVVLVTGGARGVTAAVAIELAKAYKPTLILLGRTPFVDAAESDWQIAAKDETELKQALASRASSGTTPKEIAGRAKSILANREIRATLETIRSLGAQAEYRAVDVREAAAVDATVSEIRRSFGSIAALIHGSGVLADRRIVNKKPEDFAAVFGTKVDGFRNLLAAIADDSLKAMVVFSSTTARLGRFGQSDYAMANEALNKLARAEQRRRPHCKVVAANWGPWAGGMVTAELEKLFRSEGIGLIELDGGAQALVAELQSTANPVEVVYVGSRLPNSELGPIPANGRVAVVAEVSQSAEPPVRWEQAFEREFDLATHPILATHVLDGRAVAPLALSMEWLAHAALHVNPGLAFHGLDNVRVLKGLHVDRGRGTWIQAFAGKAVKRDGLFWTPVELRSRRADGSTTLHVAATACLASTLPTSKPVLTPSESEPYPWSSQQAYEQYLFHGPELQGIRSILTCGKSTVVANLSASPAPDDWLVQPLRGDWLADPLALDCVFQLMIVWSFENYGIGSLPTSLGRYRQFRRRFPSEGTRAVISVKRQTPQKAVADVELLDADGALVARIDDYECTLNETLKRAFAKNRLELVASR